MSQISRALGQGASFDFKGKTYSLSPWTYKIMGEYEQHLKKQAVAVTRELMAMLPPEEARLAWRDTQRDIISGAYTFGSSFVQESLQSVENQKVLFLLMLKPNHPEVTPEFVHEVFMDSLENAVGKIEEANLDPNGPGGETSPPTGSSTGTP